MINVDIVRTMHFNSTSVRCISLDGKPWFIAADVMKCLEVRNTTTAVKSLRDHECRKVSMFGAPEQHALSAEGVQKKLMCSRKQDAQALLDWIQRQAIPAFREAAQAEKLAEPDTAQVIQRLAARVTQLEQQLVRAVLA